eukprot:567442-Rhodomonas_salina.1
MSVVQRVVVLCLWYYGCGTTLVELSPWHWDYGTTHMLVLRLWSFAAATACPVLGYSSTRSRITCVICTAVRRPVLTGATLLPGYNAAGL